MALLGTGISIMHMDFIEDQELSRGQSFRFGGWKPSEHYLKEHQISTNIFSGMNSVFKLGSSSIAVPKPLPVITIIPLRKCFFSLSLMCQKPHTNTRRNQLINWPYRRRTETIRHKGQVLKRAWCSSCHCSHQTGPSGLAGCQGF